MSSNTFNLPAKTALSLAISLSFIAPIQAADFTITNGVTENTKQTLNANETGTIELGGTLDVADEAVEILGDNATLTNDGTLSATGANNHGVLSIGTTDANIINNGTLTTTGDGSHGVAASGTTPVITNNGDIIVTGADSDGINSELVEGAVITNNGDITSNDMGIYSTSFNNVGGTVTNTGTINSVDDGIFTDGANNIITNSGSISTIGVSADGIRSLGADTTITNSGSISTIGTSAYGINSDGNNVTINNSGSISTTGNFGRGIFSTGPNATINNSGLISATGTNSRAILGQTESITLNLLSGSKIIGAIDLGGNTDTANIYAGSASANLTFLATENINLFGAGVVVGTNVVTVDATAESSRSVVLSGLTSSVHQVVNQRMAHTTPLKPVQLASLELSPGMLFQERAPVTWAQVFGGTSDRDGEGNALGYETDHHGFAAGYEWDSNKTRVGLMGGVALSDTAAEADSFQTDVNSYFLGAYGHFNMGSVNLTASVLTGYGDHDNERLVVDNINGLEVASSDVSSIFLSPSLTLSAAYTASETVEIRPSATISYSVAWMDDYKEKGTTSSNLTVDDRTLESWNAKLQLASAYKIDDTKELELRVGVNSRHSNDDSTHASLAGNDFSFSGVGDDSVTGGFVGANIRVATQNNLSLVADMEYGKSSDEDNLAGSLSLNYTF